MLNDEEKAVLDALASAWNAFVKLPVEHPDEQREFRTAIHQAQHLIMSRPVARELWAESSIEGEF